MVQEHISILLKENGDYKMNSYTLSLAIALLIYNVFLIPFIALYGLHSISESIPITYQTYFGVLLVYGSIKRWFSFYIEFKEVEVEAEK